MGLSGIPSTCDGRQLETDRAVFPGRHQTIQAQPESLQVTLFREVDGLLGESLSLVIE
jgi:hypothetical protein